MTAVRMNVESNASRRHVAERELRAWGEDEVVVVARERKALADVLAGGGGANWPAVLECRPASSAMRGDQWGT